MNGKTNRPVTFSYRAYTFEGKQIGIITIPQQERPFYLKKKFGKLNADTVYYRQGSSTAIATIDVIARMGREQQAPKPSLEVHFADIESKQSHGKEIAWEGERCEMPEQDRIPTLKPQQKSYRNSFERLADTMSSINRMEINESFLKEFAHYEFCKRFFKKLQFNITNNGDVSTDDVRIEIEIPMDCGLFVMPIKDFPFAPEGSRNSYDFSRQMKQIDFSNFSIIGGIQIEQTMRSMRLEINCGLLQPGRAIDTGSVYLGIRSTGEYKLTGRVLASNLPKPQEFSLTINATVQQTELSVSELTDLALEYEAKRLSTSGSEN